MKLHTPDITKNLGSFINQEVRPLMGWERKSTKMCMECLVSWTGLSNQNKFNCRLHSWALIYLKDCHLNWLFFFSLCHYVLSLLVIIIRIVLLSYKMCRLWISDLFSAVSPPSYPACDFSQSMSGMTMVTLTNKIAFLSWSSFLVNALKNSIHNKVNNPWTTFTWIFIFKAWFKKILGVELNHEQVTLATHDISILQSIRLSSSTTSLSVQTSQTGQLLPSC